MRCPVRQAGAGEAARRVLADPVVVRSLHAVVRAPRVALRR